MRLVKPILLVFIFGANLTTTEAVPNQWSTDYGAYYNHRGQDRR